MLIKNIFIDQFISIFRFVYISIIMWTIVCFIEEDCVEIVPAFWFKNGLCAWPKKNVSQRTNPNDIEFNYYKARALSKYIGKYVFLFMYNIVYNLFITQIHF